MSIGFPAQRRMVKAVGPLRQFHAPHISLVAKGWSSKRVEAKLDRGLRDIQFKDNLLGLPDEKNHPSDVMKDLSL